MFFFVHIFAIFYYFSIILLLPITSCYPSLPFSFLLLEVVFGSYISSENFAVVRKKAGFYGQVGLKRRFVRKKAGFYGQVGLKRRFVRKKAGFYGQVGLKRRFVRKKAGFYGQVGLKRRFVRKKAGFYGQVGLKRRFVRKKGCFYGQTIPTLRQSRQAARQKSIPPAATHLSASEQAIHSPGRYTSVSL